MQDQTSTTSFKKKRVKNPAAKGKQFERDVANALGHIFPEAQRMLEYQASNVIGVDIEGTDPFLIQCKNHANYCPVGTINEIRVQNENQIPVLVTKGIRLEAMAVLPFEKFVTLLEVAYGLRPRFIQQSSERQTVVQSKLLPTQTVEEIEWEEVESPFVKYEDELNPLELFI
jgi:hypothetical protein